MNLEPKDYGLKCRLCGDLCNIWFAHEVHLQVAAEHHHFKIKNSYTFFFSGSADSIESRSEGLWVKMSSLLDLGNIWLAHEVHLQVAAEHHHFKIKNSYTFFFSGSADSIESRSERLWFKMSSLR